MSAYVLPELSYDYAALEPHISARIMELHHSKHHAAYVAGANAALDQLAEARSTNDARYRTRCLAVLRWAQGKSQEVTAEELGCSASTVGSAPSGRARA